MKRVISATLALIIVFVSSNLPSYAATLTPSVFDVVAIVGSENLTDIFGKREVFESDYSSESVIGSATIDYNLNTLSPFKGDASASITLWINDKTGIVEVSGQMTATLVNSALCWEGCLQGTLTIDDAVLDNVLVGIIKFDTSNNLSVTITIPSSNITVIAFSSLTVSAQDYEKMSACINTYSPDSTTDSLFFDNAAQNNVAEINDVYQPIPGSAFSIVGNAFTSFYDERFPNLTPYYDQRARVLYAKSVHRLALTFKSYCGTLNNYFVQNRLYPDETYITGVSRLSMSLNRLGGTDNTTYIAGIEKQTLLTSYQSPSQLYLSFTTVFLDLLNMLGVPTNSVQAYLENRKGSFNVSVGTDNVEIDIFAPQSDYYDFDNIEQGIPVIAQLATTQIHNSWGTYAYSTRAIYKTRATRLYYEAATHIPQWLVWNIYYSTQFAASSVTVDVSMN